MNLKKIRTVISISGPPFKWFFAISTFTAGYLIGSSGNYQLFELITAALIFGFLAQAGTRLINDYFDYDIDKHQNSDPYRNTREIIKGDIGKDESLITGFMIYSIGIITAFIFLNILSSVMFLLIAITSYLYSKHMKKIFPLNTISINMIYGLYPIIAGYSIYGNFANIPNTLWIYILIGFFAGMASNNIKDITDIKGDKKYSVKNLATIYGKKKTITICAIFLLLSYFTLNIFIYTQHLPFQLIILNLLMFPIIIFIMPRLHSNNLNAKYALPILAFHNILFLILIPILIYL